MKKFTENDFVILREEKNCKSSLFISIFRFSRKSLFKKFPVWSIFIPQTQLFLGSSIKHQNWYLNKVRKLIITFYRVYSIFKVFLNKFKLFSKPNHQKSSVYLTPSSSQSFLNPSSIQFRGEIMELQTKFSQSWIHWEINWKNC